MTAGAFSWLAFLVTVVTCGVVDGALLLVATWLAGDLTTGLWWFVVAGGPITVVMAGPMYVWFKDVLRRRAAV
jgi:hypothetical protein